MNRFSLSVVASIAMLASGTALAQSPCERPESIDNMPNGESATLDEMIEAQNSVRAFNSAMEDYIDCLDNVIDAANEDTPPDTVEVWITAYNEGVGEMEATAARFNEELVAYRQTNPSD